MQDGRWTERKVSYNYDKYKYFYAFWDDTLISYVSSEDWNGLLCQIRAASVSSELGFGTEPMWEDSYLFVVVFFLL